jgi:ribosomal protein L11 methyltransferase
VIAVATTEPEFAAVEERLQSFGVSPMTVLSPTESRRVILGDPTGEWQGERLAVRLRAEGLMAVTRPDTAGAVRAWLRDTQPVVFGDSVSVCHAWSEHDRHDLPGLIELGPSGFGNGHHPTTRLIVEDLLVRIEGGESVLDVGCGSGILGLCALELGAASVVGIDLDADAVAATQRNAELNDFGASMQASMARIEDIHQTFDVVVANIARSGVVELAGELVAAVSQGGWIAVSGITPSQVSQVAGFLRPLIEVDRRADDGWSVLVLA